MGVRIIVQGERAQFRRPERLGGGAAAALPFTAAIRIFKSIYWKPAIEWRIKRIRVLNPIRWATHGGVPMLIDVRYLIEAEFTLTARAGPRDNTGKHLARFCERAAGTPYETIYLGHPDFAAEIELLPKDAADPISAYQGQVVDLGPMANGSNTRAAFHAIMIDGDIRPGDAPSTTTSM